MVTMWRAWRQRDACIEIPHRNSVRGVCNIRFLFSVNAVSDPIQVCRLFVDIYSIALVALRAHSLSCVYRKPCPHLHGRRV